MYKTNCLWEFGKFTSRDGESMESYYSRFYKLMNELTRNNLQVTIMQVNVQFLQQLQPEWSRYLLSSTKTSKIKCNIIFHKTKCIYQTQRQRGRQTNYTSNSESDLKQDSDMNKLMRDKEMQKIWHSTCTTEASRLARGSRHEEIDDRIGRHITVTWSKIPEVSLKNHSSTGQHIGTVNASLTQELEKCKSNLDETNSALGEAIRCRDSCLIALQNKHNEFEKYKAFNDRMIDYEILQTKLNETLGLLALKDIEI
ncbi:hypothetical protein Tco_0180626 [Tanacetum coccineum]